METKHRSVSDPRELRFDSGLLVLERCQTCLERGVVGAVLDRAHDLGDLALDPVERRSRRAVLALRFS